MSARVLVTLKVYPVDIEVDLDDLAKRIAEGLPKEYKLLDYKKEPIAFGLNALMTLISIPEETVGGTEDLEERVKRVDGVSEVEVLFVRRVS
ncbi:MAG: elongation factor 1-beta [Thermoplasmata archaeon]|nr:MAG: elongation factor 1-beta [Thermoplasmata archaeon]